MGKNSEQRTKRLIFTGRKPPFYICEGCNTTMPGDGWFKSKNGSGWSMSGRSRKMFRRDTKNHVCFAAWCPKCRRMDETSSAVSIVRLLSNPTEKDVMDLYKLYSKRSR